jgi:hypothetical protein
MNQKSSIREVPQSVSQALTADSAAQRECRLYTSVFEIVLNRDQLAGHIPYSCVEGISTGFHQARRST